LLAGRYKSGKYVCDICTQKKDFYTKANYLAHMLAHFKPEQIAFINEDYIIAETRMEKQLMRRREEK
jgi:hypothetical protein